MACTGYLDCTPGACAGLVHGGVEPPGEGWIAQRRGHMCGQKEGPPGVVPVPQVAPRLVDTPAGSASLHPKNRSWWSTVREILDAPVFLGDVFIEVARHVIEDEHLGVTQVRTPLGRDQLGQVPGVEGVRPDILF